LEVGNDAPTISVTTDEGFRPVLPDATGAK
jgi:hypothetical protein